MDWHAEVAAEFTRRRKIADAAVVEEMAQHTAAAYEAARADGESAAEAESRVRALVESWCAAATGPRRLEGARPPEVSSVTRGAMNASFQDVRFGRGTLASSPGLSIVVPSWGEVSLKGQPLSPAT